MKKFKDPNSVSITPKFYTAPNGTKLQWRSDRVTFDEYVAQVQAYANADNFPPPSAEELEDTMCRQMPSWACAEPEWFSNRTRTRDPFVVSQRAGGCRSCNKRQ
jgi:hypothetical protein